VIPTGGTAPYVFLWSASAGSQITGTATNLLPGNYTVLVTDLNGCTAIGTVTVYADTLPAPMICMVTCDGGSVNNIVYWDKTLYAMADSFIVYREVTPGTYARIAAVSNDSLSEYIDTSRSVGPANGDPNIQSYRYKLQIVDTCGTYGPLGLYHSTIYIEDAGSGLFTWSIPYTIESLVNPVSTYILLCDTANVDVWGPVQVVAGSASVASDPGFASHASIANWRVKTGWSISCTPTRATVNTSRSNIKHGALTTGVENTVSSVTAILYPNPASDLLNIELSNLYSAGEITVFNSLGQEVYKASYNAAASKSVHKVIDISSFASGLYHLQVSSVNGKLNQNFIVR
jgi:hypothetical protein